MEDLFKTVLDNLLFGLAVLGASIALVLLLLRWIKNPEEVYRKNLLMQQLNASGFCCGCCHGCNHQNHG